jgi:competence protein ComEC
LSGSNAGSGLWAAAKESARAWLSTAPFLAVCFGTTSLVALIANVLLLPLGAALIPLVVAQLLAAGLGIGDVCGTRWAFETASGAFIAASRLCSSLDPGLRIPPLTLVQGLGAALLAASWLARARWSFRLNATGLALMAGCVSEWNVRHDLAEHELRVTFLDVGQGDSVLLQTGTGHTALIDAGGAVHGGPDPGAESVLPLLRALRISKLDLVVLSHPHPDHYGGLRAVLDTLPVAELWDTGQAEAEQAEGSASQLLRHARAAGVRVRRPSELCGRGQRLGAVPIQVLAPCPAFDEALGPNDNSFVLRLQHGARSFLFTGDVEHEAEASLVQRLGSALDSDVLKVPHHGSRTSSTAAFLKTVSPRLSVISAGAHNRFGHPHEDVLERMKSASERVLRTDRAGGIKVTSDGQRLSVEAFDPTFASQI